MRYSKYDILLLFFCQLILFATENLFCSDGADNTLFYEEQPVFSLLSYPFPTFVSLERIYKKEIKPFNQQFSIPAATQYMV